MPSSNAWNVFDHPNVGAVQAAITVTGTVSTATVAPVAGRSVGNSTAASGATNGAVTDVFSNKTGIAGVSNLTMATGAVTLVLEGKTFKVDVTGVDVDAFAGAFYDGLTSTQIGDNSIAGSLTVDGEPVTIPAATLLVDPYDQAVFTSTYSCVADLGGDTVPFGP